MVNINFHTGSPSEETKALLIIAVHLYEYFNLLICLFCINLSQHVNVNNVS